MAAYPPAVASLVDTLLDGIREALGDNLTGAYLCGSLALGAFDPETSDVDVLIVTETPLTDAELSALRVVHDNLPPLQNRFAQEYEVYYLDRETVRRFAPGQRHVKVGPDDALAWTEHRPSFIIERWTVRERGITLAGPDPNTLIDLVSPDDLRSAAASELLARLQNWRDGCWPLSEIAHRGSQGFEIETICRVLRTVETGEVASKDVSVEWAAHNLPQRWHPLIAWSRTWRKDQTQDETHVDEVFEFLAWAAAEVS